MDPNFIGPLSVAIAIGIPAIAAAISIIPNATALAAVGTEKPEILNRLLITIVLASNLAIYGLLISFILLGKLPTIQGSSYNAYIALSASLTMALSHLAAGFGISYSGTSLIAAVFERPEIYTQLVISVILSEAIAIFGLLISFILIGQI